MPDETLAPETAVTAETAGQEAAAGAAVEEGHAHVNQTTLSEYLE